MSSTTQPSSIRYLQIVSSLFVTVLIVSNIASAAKIVDMGGISLFGTPLAFDGGTLLFPFAYILGDILTEVYGFKTARKVIWTGFAALILTAFVFFVLGLLPPENYWEEEVGSAAYNLILGGISSGGIVIASLAAYLAGEFSNSIILSKIKVKMKGRLLWVRTIGSSLAGQLIDTFIFVFIATITGVFGWGIFWSLIITNYILKCGIEAAMTPLTYLASDFLKKKEGIDVYDVDEKYRLF